MLQMPNRLSVDGKNLHDLEVENMRAQVDPQMAAAGMAIPDKITLTGTPQLRVIIPWQFRQWAVCGSLLLFIAITIGGLTKL